MVDAKSMTPEEAQAHLIKLQEKTRQKQREYIKRKQRQGQKRINTFVSDEAATVLAREQKDTGRTISEILSDALLIMAEYKTNSKAPIKTKSKQFVSSDQTTIITTGEYNREQAEQRIMELAAAGMGPTAIGKQLDDEGFPTATGKPNWDKSVISRTIKRLKG